MNEGDYLVSGSFAGHLYIWSVKDGSLVKSYQVKSDMQELQTLYSCFLLV